MTQEAIELEEELDQSFDHLTNPGKMYLLDTGAVINLYHQFGLSAFDKMLSTPESCYILPDQVVEELEHQYNQARYATLSEPQCKSFGVDLGTRKVPFELMTYLWTKIGMNELLREKVEVPEGAADRLRSYQSEGSGEKKNTRLGKGDIGLIILAEQMDNPDETTIIVSPDSDITDVLKAMPTTSNVIHLKETYADQSKSLEHAASVCDVIEFSQRFTLYPGVSNTIFRQGPGYQ
ncbi:hypothetical protein HN587_03520 [Candidatus Woesearchaeota archaeon]|jgi:hypothetical protein|nr:hypothetical protein [Candidatus Woesearchaeota archaeon]